MRKNFFQSCLIFFIGQIVGVILFLCLIVFIFTTFSKDSVVIKDNSWLVLDFSGQISEKPLSKIPPILSSSQPKIELMDYINSIIYAAADDRIKGILINGDFTFYPKGYADEIRKAITEFKESGKEVIAWFSVGNNRNYSLCMAADSIYMPDTDSSYLTIKGYYQSMAYCKKGLDELGVEFNVIHIGDFKGTGENLVREDISPELKESYTRLLDSLNTEHIKEISDLRKIKNDELAALIGTGKSILMTPDAAVGFGFIDEKKSYEDLTNSLAIGSDFTSVSLYDYSHSIHKKSKFNRIAVIYIDGTISNYYSGDGRFSGSVAGAKTVVSDIKEVKKDKSVKAVVLRVNSPGGSALASEQIFQELIELKKEKPLYVSFGPIAASGGYYISCAGDRIFAMPSTLTGSIGVVSVLMNYKELGDKFGIDFKTIKNNRYDDFLSPTRKPLPEEIGILHSSMEGIYNEFISHVLEGRQIDKNKISGIAEGRVWTGSQSTANKLVDEIGGLMDAIDYAAATNGVENYSIDSYPKPPDFFNKLSNINQIKVNPKIKFVNDENVSWLLSIYDMLLDSKTNSYLLLPFYKLP